MTTKTTDIPENRLLQDEDKNSGTEAATRHETQEPEAATRQDTQKQETAACQAAQESVVLRSPFWKDLLFLLIKVASIVIVLLLLVTFLYGIVRYHEPSMALAIKDGDLVLFYRYSTAGFLPQDVIMLNYNGQHHARRVVATAGDTVDITDDGLIVNGALQHEPEIFHKTERYQEGVSFPLTVPEGHVFVLADSRTGAADSRIYGCVKAEDTLGKVMTVIRRRGI